MSPELDDLLCTRHPKIFADRYRDLDRSSMGSGFEVGDSWHRLIDALCESLQFSTDHAGEPQVIAAQVKEKFGGLRFRAFGLSERQRGMIYVAEHLSQRICPDCGEFFHRTSSEQRPIECGRCRGSTIR